MSKPLRVCLLILGAVLIVGGGLAVIESFALKPTPVTALRVDATVRTNLAPAECDAGGSADVTFAWQGRVVREKYYPSPCSRTYRIGDSLALYVNSRDETDLGPTRGWILHPDQHDPFDFIGPNGRPAVLRTAGVGLAVLGFLAIALALLVGRESIHASKRPQVHTGG